MKFKNFVISFSIIFFCSKKTSQKSSQFESSIQDLSKISRLVNAISIQDTLKSEDSSLLISELIHIQFVDNRSVIDKLDTKPVSAEIQAFHDSIKKSPNIDQTVKSSVENGLIILNNLTEHVEVLNLAIKNPSGDVLINVNIIREEATYVRNLFPPAYLTRIRYHLKDIAENDFDSTNSDKDFDVLLYLKQKLNREDLKAMIQFATETHHSDYLEEIETLLNDVRQIANLAKQYHDNFDTIQSLNLNVNVIKGEISKVKDFLDHHQNDLNKLSIDLSEVEKVKKSLKSVKTRKYTIGLPNGIQDMELLFEDLKGKWLKDTIANGQDLKILENGLYPMKSIIPSIKKLEDFWKKIYENKVSYELMEKVQKFVEKSEKKRTEIQNNANINGNLDDVGKCTKGLKKIQKVPDFEGFQKMLHYLKRFEMSVFEYQSIVKNLINLPVFAKITSFVEKLEVIYVNVDVNDDGPDASKDLQSWNSIKNMDLKHLTELINTFEVELDKIPEEPFFFEGDIVSMLSIPDILKSFEGTDMSKSLECLPKDISIGQIEEILEYGSEMEKLKSDQNVFDSVKLHLESIDNLKQSMISEGKIVKDTLAKKKGTHNMKLENSGNISKDLGLGVQTLKEIVEIKNSKESIESCLNPDDIILNEILKIQGTSEIWSEKTKNKMKKLDEDIRFMESNLRPDGNLTDTFQIFFSAAKLEGVEIPTDSKTFQDVSIAMQSKTDPESKKFVSHLEKVQSLDLDFSNHRTLLRKASKTFGLLDVFFKSLFPTTAKIVTSPDSSNSPIVPDSQKKSEKSSNIIWIIVICSLVIILGLIAWLLIVFIIRRVRNGKYERRWMYGTFYEELSKESVHDLVEKNKIEDLKRLLKKGENPNTYSSRFETALHISSRLGNVKMVQLLLSYGCRSDLVDSKQNTPLENLTDRESQCGKALKPNKFLVILKKLFNPYAYSPVLPPQYPSKDYRIVLQIEKSLADSFSKKFPQLIYRENGKRRTHVVYKTDDNLVIDADGLNEMEKIEFIHFLASDLILVSQKWIDSCVSSKSGNRLYGDYENRIRGIKFNQKVYMNLDTWKLVGTKRKIPPMYDHFIFLIDPNPIDQSIIRTISSFMKSIYVESEEQAAGIMRQGQTMKGFLTHKLNLFLIYKDEKSVDQFKQKFNIPQFENSCNLMSLDDFYHFLFTIIDFPDNLEKGKKKGKQADLEEECSE